MACSSYHIGALGNHLRFGSAPGFAGSENTGILLALMSSTTLPIDGRSFAGVKCSSRYLQQHNILQMCGHAHP